MLAKPVKSSNCSLLWAVGGKAWQQHGLTAEIEYGKHMGIVWKPSIRIAGGAKG
jgi:hypothetical protein